MYNLLDKQMGEPEVSAYSTLKHVKNLQRRGKALFVTALKSFPTLPALYLLKYSLF
jgi:hypothetical protein